MRPGDDGVGKTGKEVSLQGLMIQSDSGDKPDSDLPLCVDLDGTLVSSDLLIESFFLLLKKNPLIILKIPLWIFQGKARLKEEIAARTNLDIASLPYQSNFLGFLKAEKGRGRQLVLATSASLKFAHQVADHLGIFSNIIASEGSVNLSGKSKRVRLVSEFGEKGFDYAGNGRIDLEVWSSARSAILVNPDPGVRMLAANLCPISHVFDDRKDKAIHYVKALRLHQWLKNLLVFLPLILAHKLWDRVPLEHSLIGFLSFGLCASSVYLLNDLLDLESDRNHPAKRHRPFAAGHLPILHGAMLIPFLLLSAIGVALFLPFSFLIVLGGYYFVTLAYSVGLKRVVILDVLILAGLYTVRILAGVAATGLSPSFWLLAFSLFFFLSLALIKRYSELLVMRRKGQVKAHGRGYHVEDFPVLMALGGASGYLSVLVLAFYLNSTEVQKLYHHPSILWLICPLVLFWVSHMWLITHRGSMHDDPVVFAATDRVSLGIAAACAILFGAAL